MNDCKATLRGGCRSGTTTGRGASISKDANRTGFQLAASRISLAVGMSAWPLMSPAVVMTTKAVLKSDLVAE